MIYAYQNRDRKPSMPHRNAWFIGKGNFDPLNARDYETYEGIRPHVETDSAGNELRDSETNEKVRTYFDDIKYTHLLGFDFEPVPMAKWNTDADLDAYNDWHVGLIRYLRKRMGGVGRIGAYYPVFDETPPDIDRDRYWRGRIKSGRRDDGQLEAVSMVDLLDVIMPPTYGYADIDCRDWLPQWCDYMMGFNKEVIPHVWGKHKDRDAPGKPYVLEDIDDFTWKMQYMADRGITSVNLWFTGNSTTDPGGREQMKPYHDIVDSIFGDAA